MDYESAIGAMKAYKCPSHERLFGGIFEIEAGGWIAITRPAIDNIWKGSTFFAAALYNCLEDLDELELFPHLSSDFRPVTDLEPLSTYLNCVKDSDFEVLDSYGQLSVRVSEKITAFYGEDARGGFVVVYTPGNSVLAFNSTAERGTFPNSTRCAGLSKNFAITIANEPS